jgi:hypothetical protein
MIRKILLVVALSTIIQGQATAMIDLNKYSQKLYKPVAMVENHTVTDEDLQQKIAIMRMSGIDLSREEALENLLNQEAILYTNKDRPLSQEAITFTIKKLSNDNGISEKEFQKLLAKFSVNMANLRKHVAAQMVINEMVMDRIKKIPQSQRHLYKKTRSTIEEINHNDKILSQPIIEYTFNKNSQVKIAEIIVKQEKNFQSIIELLKQGENFSVIKSKFPKEVEVATNDGIIGWLNFNEMSDLYKQVISSIKINQIGEPLVANNNFLFIKLLDIKNVTQSKKFLNPQYVNLAFNEKSDQLYNQKVANLISHNIIQQIRQQLYVEIF